MSTQPSAIQNANYRIFALINRLNIEATPINFELLHEIISGNNQELRERFARLGKNVTAADMEDLAREYLPHHFGQSIFERSANTMRDDLEELLGSLRDSRSELESYSSNLGASSDRISRINPQDANAIRSELAAIAALTNDQMAKSAAIMDTLDAKLASVNQLSSEMDAVHQAKFTHPTSGLGNRRAFNKHMAELYNGQKFPDDTVLIFGSIRSFDAMERPEFLKVKEFLVERMGKIVSSILSVGDFAAWTDKPHIALLLKTAQDSEIERLTSIVSEQFQAAANNVRRSAPHLPAMSIAFGAATTYTAQNAAGLIEHSEKALMEAAQRASAKVVIFGQNRSDGSSAGYALYGRSMVV